MTEKKDVCYDETINLGHSGLRLALLRMESQESHEVKAIGAGLEEPQESAATLGWVVTILLNLAHLTQPFSFLRTEPPAVQHAWDG